MEIFYIFVSPPTGKKNVESFSGLQRNTLECKHDHWIKCRKTTDSFYIPFSCSPNQGKIKEKIAFTINRVVHCIVLKKMNKHSRMGYEQNKNVQMKDSSHFGPMINPSSSESQGMITRLQTAWSFKIHVHKMVMHLEQR